MIKGFKDFLLRGNVIDLAVAFVIGVAFATVITAFTENIIQPIINAVGGRESLGLGFFIRDNDQKTFVDIGAFITALITFVITAAAIYFLVVVPVKRADGASEPRRGAAGRGADRGHRAAAGDPRLAAAAEHLSSPARQCGRPRSVVRRLLAGDPLVVSSSSGRSPQPTSVSSVRLLWGTLGLVA